MTLPRLKCCRPTAAAAGSSTLVHSPVCVKAGRPITTEEYARWRDQLEHPAGKNLPDDADVVSAPARKRPPRKRPELWNVGFRDPAWEEEPW